MSTTAANKPEASTLVTEVHDGMCGHLKHTNWSKPYLSALIHNNPDLPFPLLEHVNCTYLSTPGRPPTLLALKQHAQSLAVLISLLAPSQQGSTLSPPNEEILQGDKGFAQEQAFDWLNDLGKHYHTDDRSHKLPLNALVNLYKSNDDWEGPKFHCPMDNTPEHLAEDGEKSGQRYRPFASHTILMQHANEILERLDHEYSAMGGILAIIPSAIDGGEHGVKETEDLGRAKTTLLGQWILFTQNLVGRMHELEIAYAEGLELLAGGHVNPLQHRCRDDGVDWPRCCSRAADGHTPQGSWVIANAGKKVLDLVHEALDDDEDDMDLRDDRHAKKCVLGDAAFAGSDAEATDRHGKKRYHGTANATMSCRFSRIRDRGGKRRGPIYIVPAVLGREDMQFTRDMKTTPTAVLVPAPTIKTSVTAWEERHRDLAAEFDRLRAENTELTQRATEVDGLRVKKTKLRARNKTLARQVRRALKGRDEMDEKYSDLENVLANLKQNDKKTVNKAIRAMKLKQKVRALENQMRDAAAREKELSGRLSLFGDAYVDSLHLETINRRLADELHEVQAENKRLKQKYDAFGLNAPSSSRMGSRSG